MAFLFVYEISLELLNGFVLNSHRGCVWSDEFEGQGQRSRSPGIKRHFSALSVACMQFMFGKTSLASSFDNFYIVMFHYIAVFLVDVDGIMPVLFCRPIIAVASYCGMIKLWQYRKRYVRDHVVFLFQS